MFLSRPIPAVFKETIMRTDKNIKSTEGGLAAILSVVGILFAAAAPVLASHTLLQTTPADEIGGALLAVALIVLVIDRNS